MAQEFEGYFQNIVEMLEKIGNALPQLRDYEQLFPNHERLLVALSSSYLIIVRFCNDVKNLFKPAMVHNSKRSGITRTDKWTSWKLIDLQYSKSAPKSV
jgi:hypothetical protein